MKLSVNPPPQLSDYPRVAEGQSPDVCSAACSVVTVAFNSEKTLQRTLDSVRSQSVSCQHIVIDGGSRDGTLEMARASLRAGDILVSEPDGGISDAINKGLALAQAPAVAILHSDDWFDDQQVATALQGLETTGADFVFGDVIFYKDGAPIYRENGEPHYASFVNQRMPAVPHPSIMYRRSAFERIGLYRTDLKLAMDYEWLLRSVRKDLHGAYVPGILAHMNHDGASNNGFRRTQKEVRDIAVAYGRPWLLATSEMWGRIVKTSIGRAVGDLDPALYLKLRKIVNPNLKPHVGAPDLGTGAEASQGARRSED